MPLTVSARGTPTQPGVYCTVLTLRKRYEAPYDQPSKPVASYIPVVVLGPNDPVPLADSDPCEAALVDAPVSTPITAPPASAPVAAAVVNDAVPELAATGVSAVAPFTGAGAAAAALGAALLLLNLVRRSIDRQRRSASRRF